MKMKMKLILAALMGVFIFSSCAKYPQAQIDEVNVAVDSVKAVGGEAFVPEVFKALTDSFASAMTKVETDKSKLFKTYKDAKASLETVKVMASDALVKVEVRKAEVKAENDLLLAEVKELVIANKELLSKLPKGKDGKEVIIEIKNDVSVIEASVAETESLINLGDILPANIKIKAAKESALKIKAELEEVFAKISGK